MTIVDKSLDEIEKVIYEDDVLNHSADELLDQHYSVWETIWSEGNVQVHGDLELERVVLAENITPIEYDSDSVFFSIIIKDPMIVPSAIPLIKIIMKFFLFYIENLLIKCV